METFQQGLDFLLDPETAFGVMDPVYALYIVYGIVRGLFRGFPDEVAQVAGTVLVIVGAHFFYQPVSAALVEHTQLDSEEASLALAYLLLVLLFFIVWRVITLVIRKALEWTCPRVLNRPGGALLGGAKCVLILSVVLTAVQLSGHQILTDHLITRSWMGRTLEAFLPDEVPEGLPDWIPGAPEPSPSSEESEDGSGDA